MCQRKQKMKKKYEAKKKKIYQNQMEEWLQIIW